MYRLTKRLGVTCAHVTLKRLGVTCALFLGMSLMPVSAPAQGVGGWQYHFGSYGIESTEFLYFGSGLRLGTTNTILLAGSLRWGETSNRLEFYNVTNAAWEVFADTGQIFDGNYNSLSNTPTLFDGNYASLTNTPAYPVFRLPLGGSWTDFEIKASTNNFTDTVYYYRSWTAEQHATNPDNTALVYYLDDYSTNVMSWLQKGATNSISSELTSTNSVVRAAYFFPSRVHAVTDAADWMWRDNKSLVWSYVRVDDIGPEENAAAAGVQSWAPVRPESWEIERTEP